MNEHNAIAAHAAQIVDQFTKQAVPFAASAAHLDEISTLIEMSGAAAGDRVLDVACGPGLVACEFARVAGHITGVDITAKMIDEARARAAEHGLSNTTFEVSGIEPLPFADGSFDRVVTRYTFHHFLEPAAALREMMRVCRPGGTVLVADMCGHAEHMPGLNRMEKLRDPSHVRALASDELESLLRAAGLRNVRRKDYRLDFEVERQLAKSFPNPGDDEKIRAMFREDLTTNSMGLDARDVDGRIEFQYFITVCVGVKA